MGSIVPELLLDAIASRFEETGQPRGLHFTWTIAGGAPGRGLDVVGKESLAKSVVCCDAHKSGRRVIPGTCCCTEPPLPAAGVVQDDGSCSLKIDDDPM